MQRSQHLMISFATYLCGMRIRVYRAEGTTQWYTAVSTGYNANTQVNIKVDFWLFDLFYRHEAQRCLDYGQKFLYKMLLLSYYWKKIDEREFI